MASKALAQNGDVKVPKRKKKRLAREALKDAEAKVLKKKKKRPAQESTCSSAEGKKKQAAEALEEVGEEAPEEPALANSEFSKPDPSTLTVFVGQIPYSVEKDELQRHFSAQGLKGHATVRLLTHKDTGKSRGIAFVQLENQEDVALALKLHNSVFQGRQIHVQRTTSGGGNNETRRQCNEMLHKEDQGMRAMRALFSKVRADLNRATEGDGDPAGKADAGSGGAVRTFGLRNSDADERVLQLLGTVSEKVACQKLKELASQPMRKPVLNRPAYLMKSLGRMFSSEQKAEEAATKKDALDLFTVRSSSEPPRMELAAGAIVCKLVNRGAVVAALPQKWQRQHHKGFMMTHRETAYLGDDGPARVAIHLSPEGAAALRRKSEGEGKAPVPAALAPLLANGTAQFQYGLRVGAASCPGDHRAEVLPTNSSTASSPAPRFRYVELFAGIGGFRIGLDALGGNCVFASEIDSHARKTYKANFDELPAGDIRDIEASDVAEFDILTAGFPCQPFSIAGEQEGTADGEGVLFLEITRLLHEKRPACFILENVPQVKELDGGRVMKTIMAELRGAGYAVVHRTLNARPVVPQRRVRLFWVGFDRRRGGKAIAKSFQWPSWAEDGDKDHAELGNANYSTADGPLPTERARGWTTVGDILEPFRDVWKDHELTAVKLEYLARQDQYWQHSLDYHFVNEKGAARTLIGSYLKLGRSDQLVAPPAKKAEKGRRPRFFTQRECCRLMGFPESFKPSGEKRAYHELGNAVCPLVVKAIAEEVLKTGIIATAAETAVAKGTVGAEGAAGTAGPQREKKRKRLPTSEPVATPKEHKKEKGKVGCSQEGKTPSGSGEQARQPPTRKLKRRKKLGGE